ncbi:MAG: hypothetical protein WDO19_30545 [Bacteroidota bacterium]
MPTPFSYFVIPEVTIKYLEETFTFKVGPGIPANWREVNFNVMEAIYQILEIKVKESFLFSPKFELEITRGIGTMTKRVKYKGRQSEAVTCLERYKLDADLFNLNQDFVGKKMDLMEFQTSEMLIKAQLKANERE